MLKLQYRGFVIIWDHQILVQYCTNHKAIKMRKLWFRRKEKNERNQQIYENLNKLLKFELHGVEAHNQIQCIPLYGCSMDNQTEF